MKPMFGVLSVAVLGALGALVFSTTAGAGQTDAGAFSCKTVGTKMLCAGTFASARASTSTTDNAQFRFNSAGALSFFANYGGKEYVCGFGSTYSDGFATAAIGAGSHVYFQVSMTGNKCESASLDNASKYLK